jgi:UDP-GlcNAc:undecaprenyl-phosphate GlcNAc-1-phosphate transferase
MTSLYVCIYVGSGLSALAATPLAIFLARRFRILDHPRPRSIHSKAVPRTGGVAIVAAVAAACVAVMVTMKGLDSGAHLAQLLAVLIGGLFIAAIGLIDDKRSLPARVKLLAEVLTALGVWAAGVRIESVRIDHNTIWSLGWASAPITVTWILVMVNALNLIDGLDGLAAGISAIACGTIGFLAILSGQPYLAATSLAIAGAASGFLVLNTHPAKVFLGDCGSLFLGFMIGSGSAMCVNHSLNVLSLALPALAMGVPILDLALAIVRRVLNRRSVFSPDRSHIHHLMLAMGLNQHHVALLAYAISAAAVSIGLFMLTASNYSGLAIFTCIVLLLGVVFHGAGALPFHKMFLTLRRNLTIVSHFASDKRNFEEAHMQLCLADNLESWWGGVCQMADLMGFKMLCMTIEGPDGASRSLEWRASSSRFREHGVISVDLSPESHEPQVSVRLAYELPVNGSAELAGRRAALFGRLIDEYAPFRLAAERVAA